MTIFFAGKEFIQSFASCSAYAATPKFLADGSVLQSRVAAKLKEWSAGRTASRSARWALVGRSPAHYRHSVWHHY